MVELSNYIFILWNHEDPNSTGCKCYAKFICYQILGQDISIKHKMRRKIIWIVIEIDQDTKNMTEHTSIIIAFPIFQNSMQQPTPELARIIQEVSLSRR